MAILTPADVIRLEKRAGGVERGKVILWDVGWGVTLGQKGQELGSREELNEGHGY